MFAAGQTAKGLRQKSDQEIFLAGKNILFLNPGAGKARSTLIRFRIDSLDGCPSVIQLSRMRIVRKIQSRQRISFDILMDSIQN
jgi:hypothetical protein